jgi:glycosyltransferase involved in cell wall biosynthesis
MHKQKIAILANSLTNGGAEKVVCLLAGEINRKDYEVELILLENDNFYTPPKDVKVTYLSNQTEAETNYVKFFSLFYFALKLKRLLSEKKINLVQSHIYRSNFVNILAKLLGSKHQTQIVNHGILSRHKREGIRGFVVILLTKILYPYSDECILVSNEMKVDLENQVNVNKSKVINNPFDFDMMESLSNVPMLEKGFLFQKDKKYLICAGRCIKIKRFDVVIRSLQYLNDDIELVILGDGEERYKLIELAASFHLSSRVHCLGNVDNPLNFFKQSNIFILSSETEGFPMVIIEAMACGLPIISSDCISGPREILDAEGGELEEEGYEITNLGILTKIGDSKCLADAITHLIDDENLIHKFKLNSTKRITDYSIDNISNKYIQNIQGIL